MAITVSSDVYFYNVGNEFWKHYYNPPPDGENGVKEEGSTPSLGLDGDLAAHPVGYGIQKTAFQFGLGKATGVGLVGDQAGRIPTRVRSMSSSTRTPRTRPPGPGGVATAPASRSARVTCWSRRCSSPTCTRRSANGGTLYTPRLASAVLASGVGLPAGKLGDVVHVLDPQTMRSGLVSPEIRSQVLPGLIGVTNDGEGTAYFAFRNYSGPTFGGKTGTAQVANGKVDDTSWFVGFTNAENDPAQPQYVVLSMVEQAGFGSDVSAPIAAGSPSTSRGTPTRPQCRSAPRRKEGLMGTMIEIPA